MGSSSYIVTFNVDFSRKVEVENQTRRKIKYLRYDNGKKYTDSKFKRFCEEHGIHSSFSERMICLTEKERGLLLNVGLSKGL